RPRRGARIFSGRPLLKRTIQCFRWVRWKSRPNHVFPTVPRAGPKKLSRAVAMTLQPGQNVLRGRYRLLDAPLVTDKVSVSWPGVGPYDTQYLIKAWPFEGDTPDEYKRALWDTELRTMYRVGSSPGAEETILVIRDAGLDRDARCFIMV